MGSGHWNVWKLLHIENQNIYMYSGPHEWIKYALPHKMFKVAYEKRHNCVKSRILPEVTHISHTCNLCQLLPSLSGYLNKISWQGCISLKCLLCGNETIKTLHKHATAEQQTLFLNKEKKKTLNPDYQRYKPWLKSLNLVFNVTLKSIHMRSEQKQWKDVWIIYHICWK